MADVTDSCVEASGAQRDSFALKENRSHEHLENLDSWNPMSDDYKSKTFNSYDEPSVADFVNSFPGNSSWTPQPSLKSSLQTNQSDVRLFISRIPPQMTQEGLQNLFRQVGKMSYCKLISQHHRDTKIGFVGYDTVHEAEAAIQKFDGFDLGQGCRLKVALSKEKEKPTFEKLSDCESNRLPHDSNDGAASRMSESLQNGVSSCVTPDSSLTSTGRPCSFCGKSGLKWCSVCKTPYCSRDCQRNDWPKHKRVCPQKPVAERKPTLPSDTSKTDMGTDASVTHPAGNQSTVEASVNPIQPTEQLSATTMPMDQQSRTVSDNKEDLENQGLGDVFDIQNAEMFAQMMGFDLKPVKVDEESRDSDSSDESTSLPVTNTNICKEPISEVSGLQTKEPVPQGLNTEKPENIEHNMGLESVTPSSLYTAGNENCIPQRPTCARGYKPFFIKNLSMESVPSEDYFEVVVTDIENPSCFWVQLCSSEALERQNKLKSLLQESYCDSVYENFVPSSGEVCVAQFSLDHSWHRAKVDMVNNTGTLRVTYIDFGNHEDVAVENVRRITEDLVQFPRQALKLSLYGISTTSSSDQWTSESTTFLKSKVLSKRCKVQVCEQDNGILRVKLSDPAESNSDKTINESLIKAGFAEEPGRRQHPLPFYTPKQCNTTIQPDYDQQTGFNSGETRANSVNSSNQANVHEQQRSNLNQPNSPCDLKVPVSGSLHKEQKNPMRNPTQTQIRKEPFEVVINAIVNPWEFYAMKTDKQLLDKLDSLMQDLNQHIGEKVFTPQTPSPPLATGDVCAARFSQDNVWYRALILEQVSGGFRVRYMDFGNSEVVQDNNICRLPLQFQSFPPLSLTCSLAGVTKPRGQSWCPEAVQHFKSLVADKSFLCRIVFTRGTAHIVELLDPCQDRQQTVAKSLLSAGLAEEFIPRDANKQQSDLKRGLSSSLKQPGDGGSPVPMNPRNQRSGQPNFNKGEEMECSVFQSAIQAAALPLDARFNMVVTEVVSPGLFYCQLGTDESLHNVLKFTEDMNSHYNAVSYPPFVPHKDDICAAHFAKSGDWCRAYIKSVNTDGSVIVHYVDYGNTERLPPDSLRPLPQQFSFGALPFSALRCSLANITSLDASGWSDEATAFVKACLVTFSRYSVHLVGRRRGKLFLDVATQDTAESVSRTLVSQGLARVMVKPEHTKNLDAREPRQDMQTKQPRLPRGQFERHSASPLESLVYYPAIQAAEFPQDKSVFDVFVTEVAKSGLFFIQVADLKTAQNLKQLSKELNEFYHTSQPASYPFKPNQFCAARFTETGDWCRAIIKEISSEQLVEVQYVDYGNSEKLPVSSIRPLMDNFITFPFFALPCSLANVTQPESGWPDEAMELIREAIPLFQRQSAKVVGKRCGMLYLEFIISKDPPQYLSQLLVNKGFVQRLTKGDRTSGETRREFQKKFPQPQQESLSVNNTSPFSPLGDLESSVFQPAVQSMQQSMEEENYFEKLADLPMQTASGATCTESNRVYAAAIPLVDVSPDMTYDILISEVQRPDKIFFQVVNKENALGLKELQDMLNTHCSAIDNSPYKPVLGELCCAQFSGDGWWYRSVAEQELSESMMMVTFVDFGNQDSVAVDSIRRITTGFTHLPLQARQCYLEGIQPTAHSFWSPDAVNFVKERLTEKRFIAKIENIVGKEAGVKLFEIGPDGHQHGNCINHDMIELMLGSSQQRLEMSVPQEDQFDVVVTEVKHPGEIWAQVMHAELQNSLSSLVEQINHYCTSAPVPTLVPSPGQECCAQFSTDNKWYRARLLECPKPGEVVVQYVDYGNSESITADKIRPMKDEFFELPAQALKLSLANVRPANQVWSHETVEWLKHVLNQKLTAKVVHRFPQHLVVVLENSATTEGPCNINEELVRLRFAVEC